MNLAQLVSYFESRSMPFTATYFQLQANEPVTVDGLIEESVVKEFLDVTDDNILWRQVKSSVTSYIGCEK